MTIWNDIIDVLVEEIDKLPAIDMFTLEQYTWDKFYWKIFDLIDDQVRRRYENKNSMIKKIYAIYPDANDSHILTAVKRACKKATLPALSTL